MYHDHSRIQMQYIILTIHTWFGIQLGYQLEVPNIETKILTLNLNANIIGYWYPSNAMSRLPLQTCKRSPSDFPSLKVVWRFHDGVDSTHSKANNIRTNIWWKTYVFQISIHIIQDFKIENVRKYTKKTKVFNKIQKTYIFCRFPY
jgi:hypothetical protein